MQDMKPYENTTLLKLTVHCLKINKEIRNDAGNMKTVALVETLQISFWYVNCK